MKTYKYTDDTNQFVHIIDADGISRGSCLVEVIAEWLAEGNIPLPADPPPPIYLSVSPRQIKQALTATGLRAQVEVAVAAGDQDLKDWWVESLAFEENHHMILAIAPQLSITVEQVHEVFVLASSL